MADLTTRFRDADLIPVDDLVDRVAARLSEPDATLLVVRPFDDARARRELVRRLVTIAAAFLLVAAAFAAAVRIFGHVAPVPGGPLLRTPPAGWVPTGAWGPDGDLYVADCLHARILRIGPSGEVTEVAGAGFGGFTNGFSGDGGPATEAHFGCPGSPGWDAAGRLFIVDHLNDRIRMVDRDGIVSTIAGDLGGDPGDGGPAAQAGLLGPSTLSFDPEGNLYIADRDNARIRRITRDGIITTVAGTGEAGFSGDGGPATAAQIDTPDAIVFDNAGNLYFSDAANNRVRMIDANGVITTVAGTGKPRNAGDGGPAVGASLADPNGLAFDEAGNLYIADYDNNVIRKIDTAGTITTVAGTGDGRGRVTQATPALDARLPTPIVLSLAPDGRHLYIVEDQERVPIVVLDLQTGIIRPLVDAAKS